MTSTPDRGVTLVEILVTLVVLSLALLGTVGLQATVLADTQNASLRGLVAMQATSLANLMHANRAYWAHPSAPLTFSGEEGVVSDPSGVLGAATPTCQSDQPPRQPQCTPAQLAAADLQAWLVAASAWLPGLSLAGSCQPGATTGSDCTLLLRWAEHHVAARASPATDSVATGGMRSYTLHVKP